MMPRMQEGGVPILTRRALVVGALGGLSVVAGCGVRLEEDAPPLPLLPSREPLPEEGRLVALTRGCADLADLAATASGSVAADLVSVHRRQHSVLRTSLVRLGVPVDTVDAAPAEASVTTATPSASSSGRSARRRLGGEESDSAAEVVRFAGVQVELRDSVVALHAQRYAAGLLLTRAAPAVPDDAVEGEVVVELAARTEAAHYLLQVVAARTRGSVRDRAERTVETLRLLLADQVAGGSTPQPALGHPLPFGVRTTAQARRLARVALGELRSSYGPRLAELAGPSDGPGWAAAARWLGTVEAECRRWGLPLEPFPSLR
jgi:hypothetical protein